MHFRLFLLFLQLLLLEATINWRILSSESVQTGLPGAAAGQDRQEGVLHTGLQRGGVLRGGRLLLHGRARPVRLRRHPRPAREGPQVGKKKSARFCLLYINCKSAKLV